MAKKIKSVKSDVVRIDKYVIKWALINFLLRMLPLPVIGLIIYWLVISPKGILFYIFLPIIGFFILVLYFMILTFSAGLIAKAYGPIKEGVYDFSTKKLETWRAHVNFMEVIYWTQNLFRLPTTFFIPVFNYFLKAKIKGSGLIFANITDPSLVEIGDNIILGLDSIVLGHFTENGVTTFRKVKIGNNCTIGARSIISPGVTIGDNTIVGANSFVPKNKKLKPNKVYAGSPVRILKDNKKL